MPRQFHDHAQVTRYASPADYAATIPLQHLKGYNCGGPERCAVCRRMLSETHEESCARWTAENEARGYAHARAAEAHDAPDPYAAGIAKMRATMPERIDMTADLDPRNRANPNVPPDSYAIAIALDKAKKETR